MIKPPRKKPFKIDLGCGLRKKPGHIGFDRLPLKGVDHVLDLTKKWPIANKTVDEIYTCHFMEHLGPLERVHIVNEMWRVLKDEGRITLIVPHWSTGRAYGDPTHVWPPFSEFWFYYLSQEWRDTEAPHTDVKNNPHQGFKCNFDTTWGYGGNPELSSRSDDFKTFALTHYRESIFDIHATLTKKAT